MRAPLALLACAALAATALGCGPDAGSCPAVPQVCPSPAPTFSAEAQAIIRSNCQPCHEAGGQDFVHPMQTYAQIRALAPDILSQVEQCRMPILPNGSAAPFAAEDKDTLIAWLVCGAMNN